MYVFNGKRITFIFMCLLISFFSFPFFKKSSDSIYTSSLPVSDKLIVLDAGHRVSR